MVLFPEVQAKAHALIDAIVDESRLPMFEDRPTLQYIDAILRETLRWHPILPLCACTVSFIRRLSQITQPHRMLR